MLVIRGPVAFCLKRKLLSPDQSAGLLNDSDGPVFGQKMQLPAILASVEGTAAKLDVADSLLIGRRGH